MNLKYYPGVEIDIDTDVTCIIAITQAMQEDVNRIDWDKVSLYRKHALQAWYEGNERKADMLMQAADRTIQEHLRMDACMTRLSNMVGDDGMYSGGTVLIYGPDKQGHFDFTVKRDDGTHAMSGGIILHDDGRWCIHT